MLGDRHRAPVRKADAFQRSSAATATPCERRTLATDSGSSGVMTGVTCLPRSIRNPICLCRRPQSRFHHRRGSPVPQSRHRLSTFSLNSLIFRISVYGIVLGPQSSPYRRMTSTSAQHAIKPSSYSRSPVPPGPPVMLFTTRWYPADGTPPAMRKWHSRDGRCVAPRERGSATAPHGKKKASWSINHMSGAAFVTSELSSAGKGSLMRWTTRVPALPRCQSDKVARTTDQPPPDTASPTF